MILAFFLWFQTGPVPRTEFIAPTSVTRDVGWAVKHEELMKYEAHVQVRIKF